MLYYPIDFYICAGPAAEYNGLKVCFGASPKSVSQGSFSTCEHGLSWVA